MSRPHPIRDATIALTTLTAIPTPPAWLGAGPVQAAGWFPAIGGIIGAVGYGVVKLAENAPALQRAPLAVACAVVALWSLLTGGLHWRALTSVIASLLTRVGKREAGVVASPASRTPVQPGSRTLTIAAAVSALLAAGEAVILGGFLVVHQSPVLCVPLLARGAATACAWLGKPVPAENPDRALFGRPSIVSGVAAIATLGLATLTLWAGFAGRGLALAAFGVAAALVVPHLLSMAFGGMTLDVLEASVVLAEIVTFAAFAIGV